MFEFKNTESLLFFDLKSDLALNTLLKYANGVNTKKKIKERSILGIIRLKTYEKRNHKSSINFEILEKE